MYYPSKHGPKNCPKTCIQHPTAKKPPTQHQIALWTSPFKQNSSSCCLLLHLVVSGCTINHNSEGFREHARPQPVTHFSPFLLPWNSFCHPFVSFPQRNKKKTKSNSEPQQLAQSSALKVLPPGFHGTAGGLNMPSTDFTGLVWSRLLIRSTTLIPEVLR